jgi:signal transduction histidine kinase/ActR/RegA family two-component response regulator
MTKHSISPLDLPVSAHAVEQTAPLSPEGTTDILRLNRLLLALHAATVSVTVGLDLPRVLDNYCWELTNLLEAQGCLVFRWHRAENRISLLKAYPDQLEPLVQRTLPLSQYPVIRQVLLERRAQQLIVGELDYPVPEYAYMQAVGTQTMFMLPIVMQKETVGLVQIMGRQRQSFSNEDIVLAQLLSNHAVGAYENARLYARLEARAEELRTLNEISEAVASTLSLKETLTTVSEGALRLLQVEAISVALLDDDQEQVEFVAAAGRADSFIVGQRLKLTEGILGWVIRQGQPAVVPDVNDDPRHYPHFDQASGLQTRSILCVPLQTKGHIIGAISALNKLTTPFNEDDERLLTSLATPAATAIENAQLYERARHEIAERKKAEISLTEERVMLTQRVEERTALLQRQYRRQQALAAIEPIITQASDLELILRELVLIAQNNLPADGGTSIVLWQEGEAAFSPTIATGATAAEQATGPELTHASLSQAILADQTMLIVPDANLKGFETVECWLRPYNLQSLMAAPIVSQGQSLGVFYIFNQAPVSYSQEEMDFLFALSNRAGVAIANMKLYESLRQSNYELARVALMKDEFLASMSHELRTPLNAILGIAEGLQGLYYGPLTDKQSQSVQILEESGRHLLDLINDILDVAKVEAGHMTLEIAPTRVKNICESSLQYVRQAALKKSIALQLNIASSVETIEVDARRLKQVLVNLLTNGVKFTPEGGSMGLEVYDNPQRGEIQFIVWDTGIGIDPVHLPNLFQPFMQVDSSLDRRHSGTGLGLALVKRMTEMHGGKVSAESMLGKGSRFTVTIPIKQATTGHEASLSIPTPGETAVETADTMPDQPQVLLVDDNEANVVLFNDLLKLRGFRVILAYTGQEALDILSSARPDVILMDIQMPDMDGLETIRRIRSQLGLVDLPIIALTALAMSGDRERCLAAGANAYLSKPTPMRKLVETIRHCLAGQQPAS